MDAERPPDSSVPAAAEQESPRGTWATPAGTSPRPSAPPQVARRQMLAAFRATDIVISRLDNLMSTAAGQERIFAVTGYLTHVLHHLLASAPWIAVQTRLSLLARLNSRAKPTPSKDSSSQSRLLALSSLMSETRYTIRLLGLIPLWTWGSATIKSPPSDRVMYTLTLLQVFVNVIYQALENGAYLASKGIISKRFIDRWGGPAKWDLWSIRAWFGHIFLQFFVLWRKRVWLKKKMADPSTETKESQDVVRAEMRAWKKSLVNNVCWAPVCLHWCFENGIGFPNNLTGLVSFMAGAWGVADMWAATAQP
ncbi:hypothetical protein EYZ11_002695 [Aspergillus tanneri]|uniref:Uncharacterized protein n=1 Tax=Aspergillus tanneri TaxID=1220188 RepID=A0A4S3JQA6_9EURO|nr:uncharacterized protein ATNIH1004_004013 [Aspergillus tanneri]KAA8648130.1 hypothetical protein ATNIH1004_004013 [Aspergillus tanneri]THC97842.1 hypothetical protein EYZ11_002695 [Aspergillus tanneri]